MNYEIKYVLKKAAGKKNFFFAAFLLIFI